MKQRTKEQRTREARAKLLPFPQGRGGRRKGAGRKPAGERAGVSHRERDALASRYPAHITVKLQQGLPRLRSRREYAVLRTAFRAGSERFGFRLCHYAILNDHLHFLVEAKDRTALSRAERARSTGGGLNTGDMPEEALKRCNAASDVQEHGLSCGALTRLTSPASSHRQ